MIKNVIKTFTNNYQWTFPFLCFFGGYLFIHFKTRVREIPAPSLIGCSLAQAVKIVSDKSLNIRIMAEKEETKLPEGTVLSQTPLPKHKIKQNQPIFLVVSKKPHTLYAPLLVGSTTANVEQLLKHQGIRSKRYKISSHHPQGNCIGQWPAAKTPLTDQTMIVYLSTGDKKMMLFPSLKHTFVHEAQELFAPYQVTLKLFHQYPVDPDHRCNHCVIVDQKPLPGSFVDLQKPLLVQLQVA